MNTETYYMCDVCKITSESFEMIQEHYNKFHIFEKEKINEPENINISLTNADDTIEANETESDNDKLVWPQKQKPRPIDHEATVELLNIRGSDKFTKLLSDKKSVKAIVWQYIAREMINKGFKVGEDIKDGGVRCRQKFKNLEKAYIAFNQSSSKTGNDAKQPPPYYELMNDILRAKHKYNPTYLVDSEADMKCESLEEIENNETDNTTESCSCSTNENTRNKYDTVKRSVKPKKDDEVAQILQKMHEEDKEQRKQYNEQIINLLKEQNSQRNKFLNILSNLVEQKPKRKREDSDSDE